MPGQGEEIFRAWYCINDLGYAGWKPSKEVGLDFMTQRFSLIEECERVQVDRLFEVKVDALCREVEAAKLDLKLLD